MALLLEVETQSPACSSLLKMQC